MFVNYCMYKILPILLFAYSFALTTENKINNNTMNLKNSLISRAELIIDTDVDVRGLQFDIKFNPLEIKSVTPQQISGFEVKYNIISDSVIRGLIFCMTGEALPKIFVFDFTSVDGFSGVTIVEFTDFIIADKNGNPIEIKPQIFRIRFTNMSSNIYQPLTLNRDDIYDQSWAVIIGIDKYQNATNLDYAVEDAEAMKELLIGKFDYPDENVKMLVNQEANKVNIIKVISDISLSAGENDRVLVFFAGHGETMDLPDGGEMGFLFPVDGNQENLYASAIPMNDLKDWSNISNAKHMLFLVDACYGGLASVGSRSLDAKTTPNYIEKITKNKSRQIITAGGRDEKVIERPEWGHSAFTLNLKRGLGDGNADMNADGYITANELGIFLSESVTIDSENQQTPQSRKLTSQEGEFVFVYNDEKVHKTKSSSDSDMDTKLDAVLSKLEKLESQKSSGDDTIMEKAIEGKKSWHEKYGYEGRGIEFIAFEDLYQIGYVESLNKYWLYTLGYAHFENSSVKKLISMTESYSMKVNTFNLSLTFLYHLTDKVKPFFTGGAFYGLTTWQNRTHRVI